jgi:lipopolysaccharide transport system ATP-binding protein
MSAPVISIENISKSYRLGTIGTGTFYGDLKRWRAKRRGLPDPYSKVGETDHGNRTGETLWALKDINFTIQQGEAVGIIGRNGAGKSTLLKILSRVTAPTSGEVKVKGRIASLLEVGTGFHPELTGRENIFLNGAIMGMSHNEIRQKFDEIVDFSGVEKFIDTPVKRYSSGMYVRLAFAVAAHLDPEILVVDEVLAVGDAQFQKKCLGKMGEVGKEGRTVLFVSHNMTALKSLCSRAIWLHAGQLVDDGETDTVVSKYLQDGAYKVLEQTWDDFATAPGNDKVRLRRVGIVPDTVGAGAEITVRTPLRIEFECWNNMPEAQLHFSMHLNNIEGLCILNSGSMFFAGPKGFIKGSCYIPGNFLNDGVYRVMIMIVKDSSIPLYYHDDVLVFEVHDDERNGNWYGKWPGVVRPSLEWTVEQINKTSWDQK